MSCDFPRCECMCHPENCSFKEENRKKHNPCTKGMTYYTCPFNPILGCDCGVHKGTGYSRIS